MKDKIILFFLFILLPLSFSQQTRLRGNFIMVTVDNNNASFIIYGRNNKEDKWIPLLFEDFPPTSYFRFSKDGKLIPFGQGGKGNYSEISSDKNGIYYFWKNDEIRIDIIFKLFSSSSDTPLDSVLIDLTVKSILEEKDFLIDFILCLDTYLGEKGNSHFLLSNNKNYNTEISFNKQNLPDYVLSYNKEKGIGINLILNKKFLLPDRLFFANWKAVKENIGKYKINNGNSFDLKPFSINDSAIFLEYENQKIGIKSKNYKFILSMKNSVKLEDIENQTKPTTTTIFSTTTTTINSTTTTTTINTTTSTINNKSSLDLINMNLSDLLRLLDEINKKIESGEQLTQEDIDFSNAILEEIKKRRTNR
ncbi:MAG TPA: hypothetical protein PLE45_04620 [Spirochaetota bacterium]|nr:hypothetical protein [Spirochaetota bacterium]HOL56459.1 hypothetical protein [Spirochaetota bacterium]HPP03971.1 hypothetical protein [Spirochaetota bacterium]